MAQEEGHVGGTGNETASRGGCLKFGWGCLPVLLGAMMLPASLWF